MGGRSRRVCQGDRCRWRRRNFVASCALSSSLQMRYCVHTGNCMSLGWLKEEPSPLQDIEHLFIEMPDKTVIATHSRLSAVTEKPPGPGCPSWWDRRSGSCRGAAGRLGSIGMASHETAVAN